MKRSFQYLILSLFLFLTYFSIYLSFNVYLQGSEIDKKEIQFLTTQLQKVEFEKELVLLSQKSTQFDNSQGLRSGVTSDSRGPASVPKSLSSLNLGVHQKEFELLNEKNLDAFYPLTKQRIESLIEKNEKEKALNYIEQSLLKMTELNHLTELKLIKLKLKCSDHKIQEECLDLIYELVLQAPYSPDTQEALVWLKKTYDLQIKKNESQMIDQILKSEFKVLKQNEQIRR